MRKYIITAILAAAFHIGGHAQETAMSFLRLPVDPATAAMGGADMLNTNTTAYSAFGNAAAGVFSAKTMDVAASYQMWSPKTFRNSFINAGASYKIGGQLLVSAGMTMGSNPEYDMYDENGESAGTFKPKDMGVGLGVAYKLVDILAVGANFKYASSTLAQGHGYNAVAADLMLMAKLPVGFKAAAGVRSLGSSVKAADGTSFALPSSVAAGVGFEAKSLKHKIDADVDFDYYLKDGVAASVGAYYSYDDMVTVRAGYHYGGKTVVPSFLSAGIGAGYSGVRLDISYVMFTGDVTDFIKNTITFGLGYSF